MKMSKIVIISIICFVLGFVFRGFNGDKQESTSSLAAEQERGSANPLGLTRGKNKEVQRGKLRGSSNSLEPSDFKKYAYGIFSDELRRQIDEEIEIVIMDALIENSPSAAASFLETVDKEMRNEYLNNLLVQWNETNPVAALEWLETQEALIDPSDMKHYRNDVLHAIALSNPEEALPYLNLLPSGEETTRLTISIAKGWAKTDINGAFDLLESLTGQSVSDESIFDGYYGAIKTFANVDPYAASELVRDLQSSKLQLELVNTVVTNLGQKNLSDALEWVTSLPNDDSFRAGIDELIDHFAATESESFLEAVLVNQNKLGAGTIAEALMFDPDRSVEMLDRIDTEANPEVVGLMMDMWINTNQTAAIEWLNLQPAGAALEAGAAAASQSFISEDPVGAINWATRVSSKENRVELLRNVIENTGYNQLGEIETGILNSTLSESDQEIIWEELAKRRAESDPTRIFEKNKILSRSQYRAHTITFDFEGYEI